jgi:hypothetical protein
MKVQQVDDAIGPGVTDWALIAAAGHQVPLRPVGFRQGRG